MGSVVKKIFYTIFGVIIAFIIFGVIIYSFRNDVVENHIENFVSSKVDENFEIEGLEIMPIDNKITLLNGNVLKNSKLYTSIEGAKATLNTDENKTIIYAEKLTISKATINIYGNDVDKTLITPNILEKISIKNKPINFLIKNVQIDELIVNNFNNDGKFISLKNYKKIKLNNIDSIIKINNFIKEYADKK